MLLFGKYGADVDAAEKGYEDALKAVEELKEFVFDESHETASIYAINEVEDADTKVSNLWVEITNTASDDEFDRFCKLVAKLDDAKLDLLYAGTSCEDAANGLTGFHECEEKEAKCLMQIKDLLIDAYDNVADFVHYCKLEIESRTMWE